MFITLRSFTTILATAALILSLGACKTKPKVTDEAGGVETSAAGDQPPQIDSTPMSFNAAGSDSGKIEGLQSINFDYDKSSLSADSKAKLQGNVAWLKARPKTKIQIEGHCDARGSIEYNLSLGERRAQAVKSYMASLGIPSGRLSIISYGKEKPLVNGDSEADYAKNRRANFLPLE